VREAEAEKMNGLGAALARLFLGSPLKLWASVGHWAIWHFDLNKYTEKQKPRVGGGWVEGGRTAATRVGISAVQGDKVLHDMGGAAFCCANGFGPGVNPGVTR
jgi:hypothetical protein